MESGGGGPLDAAQLALYRLLVGVCERVGAEGASELVRGAFGDGGKGMGGREDRGDEKWLEMCTAMAAARSIDIEPVITGDGRYEALVERYNGLVKSYRDLLAARNELEAKVRSKRESERKWVEYSNTLEKKIRRLEGGARRNENSGDARSKTDGVLGAGLDAEAVRGGDVEEGSGGDFMAFKRECDQAVERHQEQVTATLKLQESLQKCVQYAEGWQRRATKLEAGLTSLEIPTKCGPKDAAASNATSTAPLLVSPMVPSGSVGVGSVAQPALSMAMVPRLRHSNAILDPSWDAHVEVEDLRAVYSVGANRQLPMSPHLPEQLPGGLRGEQAALETLSARMTLVQPVHTTIMNGPLAATVDGIDTNDLADTGALQRQEKGHLLSPSNHSISTQEDFDAEVTTLPAQEAEPSGVSLKSESPSDAPVVISSRSVRKRKGRTEKDETHQYAKVKVEVLSSSPIGVAGFQSLFPQESLDLDEIGPKGETPKKKRLATTVFHPTNNGGLGFLNFESSDGQIRVGVDIRSGREANSSRPKGRSSVLQSANQNKQILPRTSGKEQLPKRRKLADVIRGAKEIAEDGEFDDMLIRDSEAQRLSGKHRQIDAAEIQRRLTGLLEEPLPQKQVLTPERPPDPSAPASHSRSGATPLNRAGRQAPSLLRSVHGNTTLKTFQSAQQTPKAGQKGSMIKKRPFLDAENSKFPEDDPDQEPFRARPLRCLGLEHFKVNSNYNQGYDYAFTDVVRGREQRKCLPGCTKPECCGDKFRKFVELTSTPDEERTLSQELEDDRLLEDYLGDRRGRLRKMSRSERSELLVLARTRELSHKAGKHRHAYERRRSPPGFWRTDFPSTQELEADHEEAAKVERELVQQRYAEAMRPGGKWIFRDE